MEIMVIIYNLGLWRGYFEDPESFSPTATTLKRLKFYSTVHNLVWQREFIEILKKDLG